MIKNIAASLLLVISAAVYAEEVTTLIVPVAPGGVTDVMARLIASKLTDEGTPTIVVNRPGAERTIAANHVATSAPNGRTLLMGGLSDVILLPLFKTPNLQFGENTFVPVAFLGSGTNVLTASSKFPANNFKEFLAVIKKNPEKYPIGSYGKLSTVQAYTIFKFVGVEPTIVNYKGDVQLLTDLMGNNIDLGLNSLLAAKEQVGSKKIKLIATLDSEKIPGFPSVDTIHQYNKWKSNYWFGVFAPPGTDPTTVKVLNAKINKILKDPTFVAFLSAQSFSAQAYNAEPMTPAEFALYCQQQSQFYKPIVERIINKEASNYK